MGSTVRALIACSALLVGAAACSPVVSQRGYIPDQTKISSISPGVDTKQTVVERLGTPSTIANFEASTWYYIASEEHQTAWRRPETVERIVLAVTFDEDSKVKEVQQLSIDDSRVIRPIARKTPTKGRELGFWEQMFGSIGRLPTGDNPEAP